MSVGTPLSHPRALATPRRRSRRDGGQSPRHSGERIAPRCRRMSRFCSSDKKGAPSITRIDSSISPERILTVRFRNAAHGDRYAQKPFRSHAVSSVKVRIEHRGSAVLGVDRPGHRQRRGEREEGEERGVGTSWSRVRSRPTASSASRISTARSPGGSSGRRSSRGGCLSLAVGCGGAVSAYAVGA